MSSPLRVVFLGSDPIALPLLNWIAGDGGAHAEIVGVFTQPDRPSGRGQKTEANAIKLWAAGRNLAVRQPAKLSKEEREELERMKPDVSLVMAYGHILGERFIATPRLGTLNLHASILPKYRGASPIQTAIASGERITGVSLMRIVRELDAGPVADIETVSVGALDTAAEVEAKLAAACVSLLSRNLPTLAAGGLRFNEQEPAQASYCRRLSKSDAVLDFGAPAAELAARINGLNPWPGTFVELSGQPVRIGLAEVADETGPATLIGSPGLAPGTVAASDARGLVVRTGSGLVRFLKLQRSGGKLLPAGEFLRGFPVSIGSRLASQPMPPLVSATPMHTPKPGPSPAGH